VCVGGVGCRGGGCGCVCVCVCVEAKEKEVLEIGRNAGGTEVISATERMKIE